MRDRQLASHPRRANDRDIARRQTETGGEQRAPLKLVGRDVGEPLFQIVAIDGRRATRGRNRSKASATTAASEQHGPRRRFMNSP